MVGELQPRFFVPFSVLTFPASSAHVPVFLYLFCFLFFLSAVAAPGGPEIHNLMCHNTR